MNHRNFTSARMNMVLVTQDHAAIVHRALQDPSLYKYLPEDPPKLKALEERYAFWEGRVSPDESEYWLNYVVFLSNSGAFVGTLQAGIHREDKEASIAYMIVTSSQGQGLGTEATRAMMEHLRQDYQVRCIKAWIDTRNEPSIRLVENLGMRNVEFLPKADHFKGQGSDEFVFQIEY